MTTPISFDVFLSYNSKDKARVRRLAERLRDEGLEVWFDDWTIRPGDDIYLTVENGLKAARTLVLCMSPNSFGSDWVGLERCTVLFRDPSNAGRRFIPLLLSDCDLPDTLRRYRFVDFRKETKSAFEELLTACRPEKFSASPEHLEPVGVAPPRARAEHLKPLAILERKFKEHSHLVRGVAVSPDGSWAVSGSNDRTAKTWDLDTGKSLVTLEGHTDDVVCVAITPDGQRILSGADDWTIRIWEAQTGRPIGELRGHDHFVLSVVALPDGIHALSSGSDRTFKLWHLASGRCLRTFRGHDDAVASLAVRHGGAESLSGSFDRTLRLWVLATGECVATLKGHTAGVTSVDVAPNQRYAASGSRDRTVKLWDLDSRTCLATFEGHQDEVHSVAISPSGTLIASSGFRDHTVRLWNWETGATVQVLEDEWTGFTPSSVAFTPDGTRLVVGSANPDGQVGIYRMSGIKATAATAPTRRYVNAKVVLVGESGVGKSALAHRLVEDRFVQTSSTHGMQVWRLDLPLEPLAELEREVLLWDLAGQEDYRLIHQLFLDETALALLLFNPQKEDPFSETGEWLKALRAAVPPEDTRDVAKLLLATRVDRGGPKLSQAKINRYLRENRLLAYLATSAMRGDNCSDAQNLGRPSALKELIAKHLPWAKLPWTSTPRLLSNLKNSVIVMKEEKGLRLLRFSELAQRLERHLPNENVVEENARTAVTLLANHGLVMPFNFGDLILLHPDILNGYAASVIRAARQHTDEIGCVKEQAVYDRTIDLEGVERLEPADEELLVRAMVQTFLDKSLCIAEDTPEGRHLIFPSQYRREKEIPDHPEIFVSYTFSGEWQTVYTTLVVRLWYSREFEHRELWRNAAEFQTSKGRTVGLLMKRTGEGEAKISVFFDTDVPDELKVMFIGYVHRHLEKYARDVQRDRRYVCPACGKPVTDVAAVRERLEARKDFIYCQKCDERVPLIDHIERRLESDPVARKVLGMDERATQELDTQALEQILVGHLIAISGEANQIYRTLAPANHGIAGEVEFKADDGTASGRKIYVQLKSDESYLLTRKPEDRAVFDVRYERDLEYWAREPVDVYLVIRDEQQTIRWMNLSRFLRERSASQRLSRKVVFEGEKLDAPAIWRVRDRFFRKGSAT